MPQTKKHIITLGGFPGSGKSTIKRILGETLGYTTFSTGDFTRRLAQEKGLTLEAFNDRVLGGEKELDHLIDNELMRIEREEDHYVIDSHLAYHFVPSGFSIYLDITLDTAAARIFGDREAEIRVLSGDVTHSIEEARTKTEKRVRNHQERYMKHYGIDPYNPEQYEYVVNAETQSPKESSEQIRVAYEAWLRA